MRHNDTLPSSFGNPGHANMRLSSIVAPLACLGALVDAALTTVEFDLVFPRNNVSYAPTSSLPIIFAVKNSHLMANFSPSFFPQVQLPDGSFSSMPMFSVRTWGDPASNETIFLYNLVYVADYGFTKEGSWPINFFMGWTTCAVGPNGGGDGDSDTAFAHSSTTSILFRTAKAGQAVNLLSSRDTECPGLPGFRLTIDDKPKTVVDPSTNTVGIHQCLTVMPMGTDGAEVVSDPCTAKIPAGLVEELSSVLSIDYPCPNPQHCSSASATTATKGVQPSANAATTATHTHTSTTQPAAATTASDPPKNAAERWATAGTAWLAVTFGVFGLLLA